jgi:magnesium-transporting ATPase (P-type)
MTSSSKLIGLSSAEAANRLAEFGPNILPREKRKPAWRMLMGELTHLLAVLLWIAAGLALLAGTPALSVAIAVIVILNAVFAFWQEYRADRSTQRLRELVPADAHVIREGSARTVPASELVPGDLVILAAGDRIVADLEVIDAEDLEVDESVVTGESVAVHRAPGEQLRTGTFVVVGEARATVIATGARTTLAEIGLLAASASPPASPLTTELRRVVRIIAVVAAAVGVGLGTTSVLLGLGITSAFVFAIGVAVALIPEGLLPTVTLSLARGAEQMAARHALVRRLDAVETLGATTYICTDKTGTITQNRMNVVEVVTREGSVSVVGEGYEPNARLSGGEAARALLPGAAQAALRCVAGRAVAGAGAWTASGDPMEAAFHCLAMRAGVSEESDGRRFPYTPDRGISSSIHSGTVSVLGGPEAVFERCRDVPVDMIEAVHRLTGAGRRVLAVATRPWTGIVDGDRERDLDLLAVLALEDPPRDGVADALRACRSAGIRIAMITGDHPRTASAIAREVGLLGPDGVVLDGPSLPATDAALADAVDCADGVVVARATPADKLRIARALRSHGHVVAMTGDGVNDAPALREADVGVAMGVGGSDVAREAADLVLLDNHFATIVAAIRLGRATFKNVRRFLTYHLTDNAAELAPFILWALTGSSVPLAIGVLQVIALDIGGDMLPALALGVEPPRDDVMRGRRSRSIVDAVLLSRAFLVLGLTEAVVALGAFLVVLRAGGWVWGTTPSAGLLSSASGAAFAAIALGQMANAFACRSSSRPVWRLSLRSNVAVLYAVAAQATLLIVLLTVPPMTRLLGGSWPPPIGWLVAAASVPAVLLADAVWKRVVRKRAHVKRGE